MSLVETPEVHYAYTSDGVRVAFQVVGQGPPTVYTLPFFNHLEGMWEQPLITRVFERMAPYLRLILLESRGTGLSDRFETPPTLEERTSDIEAVVGAVDAETVNLIGLFAGAQPCVDYAVRHPEEVDRLVLVNSRVGRSVKEAADALKPDAPGPLAYSYLSEQRMIETSERLGSGLSASDISNMAAHSPSALDHPEFMRWWPRYERLWGPRESVKRQAESIGPLDIADIAHTVTVPTLITHNTDNGVIHAGYGRLLHQMIPGSTLMEFAGRDQFYWLAPNWSDIVDSHVRFLTGIEVADAVDRHFAVVMFTDIVDSTRQSMIAGDAEWHRRLDHHDQTSRRIIERHRGSVVKSTGDGVLAVFASPSAAITAATELRAALSSIGISIRAGLHAGEIDVRGDDVAGAVVNLAARVTETAGESDIVTSASLRDALLGSSYHFEPFGSHELAGFDGTWALHLVVTEGPAQQ